MECFGACDGLNAVLQAFPPREFLIEKSKFKWANFSYWQHLSEVSGISVDSKRNKQLNFSHYDVTSALYRRQRKT